VRKKGDEQAVVDEVVLDHLAVMGVHQVGNLLKSEKRDRQRQGDVLQGPAQAERLVEAAEQKTGVFEVQQQRQVGGHPQNQQYLGTGAQQLTGQHVVEPDTAQQ